MTSCILILNESNKYLTLILGRCFDSSVDGFFLSLVWGFIDLSKDKNKLNEEGTERNSGRHNNQRERESKGRGTRVGRVRRH